MSKTKRNDARGHERGQGAYSKTFKLNQVVYVMQDRLGPQTRKVGPRAEENGDRNSGRAAPLDKV